MSVETLLEGTADGDRLRLAGVGAWTAGNARRLESEIDGATRRYDAVKHVAIDMGQVERLDTFGAWLLGAAGARLYRARRAIPRSPG